MSPASLLTSTRQTSMLLRNMTVSGRLLDKRLYDRSRSLVPMRVLPRQPQPLSFRLWHLPWIRKLEKAVAVRNSLLERFSGKFRCCWKMIPRFSGSAKCYPCQGLGTFRQGKRLLEIGRACGNAAGFSLPRPPQPSWVLLIERSGCP